MNEQDVRRIVREELKAAGIRIAEPDSRGLSGAGWQVANGNARAGLRFVVAGTPL